MLKEVADQLPKSEINKLLTKTTLELYILQAANYMPLVDAVENVVRFINSLPNGYGRHIINLYDCLNTIDFEMFGLVFSYELSALNSPDEKKYPFFPDWELEYYVWDGDEAVGECDKVIGRFDFRSSNSSEPVIRYIVAHFTVIVSKLLNGAKKEHLR